MRLEELQHAVRAAVTDPALTYRQRVQLLATLAENALDPPPLSAAAQEALDKRVICDMYEGNAPYRPRYVLPDYPKALRQGSQFLELRPPTDLDEALTFLLAMYANVPSITGYPVYLGNLDELLTGFVDDVPDAELYSALRNFWVTLDRTLPDAFTHTNIGPADTRVGRIVLRVAAELRQVVPNLTLRVDPDRTPDDYVLDAVRTVFACGGPHFVNHPMMTADLGERYGVVSCYNSLLVGGGAHTLVRLNLKEVVHRSTGGVDAFLTRTLPTYVEYAAELAAARIRHLVETAGFYEHSWLVHEGLIDPDRFTAMFGVVGLAEAVDLMQEREGRAGRYGHDPAANDLARTVVETTAALVGGHRLPHCDGHRRPRPPAQSGRAGLGRRLHRGHPHPGRRRAAAARPPARRRTAAPMVPVRCQRRARLRRHRHPQPAGRGRRHPRRLRGGDARRHVQPRQQRLHPNHGLPGAQVRPRQAGRPGSPARQHLARRRVGSALPRRPESPEAGDQP